MTLPYNIGNNTDVYGRLSKYLFDGSRHSQLYGLFPLIYDVAVIIYVEVRTPS